MYIRPLVYVHHLYVTVTMSYVQRKKSTVSYIFALRCEKAIQKYSTLLYKKFMPHLLRWKKHWFL